MEAVLERLRKDRETGVLDEEYIMENYERILKLKGIPQVELFEIYEQVFLAGLFSGKPEASRKVLSVIHAKFPDSVRTALLGAMMLEYDGKYDAALSDYDKIIESEPTYMAAHKRKIAATYSKTGDIKKKIADLVEYLSVFSNDDEAWEELYEIYVAQGMKKEALFCLEELLSFEPKNPVIYNKMWNLIKKIDEYDDELCEFYIKKEEELLKGSAKSN